MLAPSTVPVRVLAHPRGGLPAVIPSGTAYEGVPWGFRAISSVLDHVDGVAEVDDVRRPALGMGTEPGVSAFNMVAEVRKPLYVAAPAAAVVEEGGFTSKEAVIESEQHRAREPVGFNGDQRPLNAARHLWTRLQWHMAARCSIVSFSLCLLVQEAVCLPTMRVEKRKRVRGNLWSEWLLGL